MEYTLFLILFLFISNWQQLLWFIKGKISNVPKESVIDTKLLEHVYKKTGVNIKTVTIIQDNNAYGMMAGLPGKPFLTLSKGVFKRPKPEVEWVLLHETAHYILNHTYKMALVRICLGVIGIFVLYHIQNYRFFIGFSLSFILGIVAIQSTKVFDVEANRFAVARMDYPQGMESWAKYKITKIQDWGFLEKFFKSLFWSWGYWMYNMQIKDTQKEFNRRKNIAL